MKLFNLVFDFIRNDSCKRFKISILFHIKG